MQTSTDPIDPDELAEELRRWARGSYPAEAATELLIRGGWCCSSYGWIREYDDGSHWVDFASIGDHLGAMSGGERRMLRVIAALGDDTDTSPVCLEDAIPGLDRGNVNLVLAAIAHAAGTHEHVPEPWESDCDMPAGTLHPWPATAR